MKLSECLKDQTAIFIASVAGTKANNRAFQFQYHEAGKIMLCTSIKSSFYKETQVNPSVCFTQLTDTGISLRVWGEVKYLSGEELTAAHTKMIAQNPSILNHYGNEEGLRQNNKMFYLTDVKIEAINLANFQAMEVNV